MNLAVSIRWPQLSMGALAVAMVSACHSLAPEYVVPATPTQAHYKESNVDDQAGWKTAQPADQYPRGQWWKVFADSTLDDLQARAMAANQGLKQAFARLQEARAYHQGTEARRLPSVSTGIGPSRELTSQSSNDVAQSANTYWRAQLNIAYEADLFGRVSDAIKASTADEQQSAALYHSVLLALQADVAANYYQLRTLDAQISIYRDTLKLREDALAFATKRKDSGQVSEMDWMRAQTELASTRAGELALVRARAAREHNLAVLLGQAPSAFDFPFMPVQPLTVEIPVGVPSALLERRPDVAAAERAMAAANARIGVAKAAYFPSLTLTGTAGYESNTLGELFQGSSKAFLLGPLTGTVLNLPLFDGGKRDADLANARAAYDEQAATYQQTVLDALREVEDNLANIRLLHQQVQAQTQAIEAAQGTSRIAQAQYQEGASDYLNVIDADRTTLQTKQALAALQGEQTIATVRLITALGGGWATSAAIEP